MSRNTSVCVRVCVCVFVREDVQMSSVCLSKNYMQPVTNNYWIRITYFMDTYVTKKKNIIFWNVTPYSPVEVTTLLI
jgi:hypothetical protein